MNAKKLVLIVLVLGTVFSVAFGQSIRIDPKSMTALSTGDLFTTDVDDFLNVNEYHNVAPKKFFGFLGYNTPSITPPTLGNGDFQFGFAKQLKSMYIAGFFGGMPVVWYSKTEPSGSKKKTTIWTEDPAAGYAPITTGTFLVGFNNMGASGSFTFKPDAGNKRVIDENAKTDVTDAKFNTNVTLRFGMNANGPKDLLYKSYAELSVESKTNKTTNKDKGTKITGITDTSASVLLVNAGTAFDFSKKDDITQGLAVGLETKWWLPAPKSARTINNGKETDYTKTVGKVGNVGGGNPVDEGNTITLVPAWTLAYEPEGKFAARVQASLPVKFDFRSGVNYTETKVGGGKPTKAYPVNRNHEFNLKFQPTFATAVTYRPISKLRFSLGASFSVPSFGWQTLTTQTRDANGKVTDKTSTTQWTFNHGATPNFKNFKFEANSGITWFVTDTVTVDGNWNIAKNLLNDSFKTQLTVGDGQSFWNTANKLLVHNVSFLVSFKL